eukprot:CAMPEP_0119123732 /NCGR_PEP_ID=MMETSP1310-20130426/3583_1 /TAXON_ID=464262 /ORGANISM="Genus nov. species nov., Strain RCC2339" /LENGTH=191 /DNA_ID=CAMNT_0007113593 /DNA_START=94 /DNA_END=669 /DNA_ORIENTATION=+
MDVLGEMGLGGHFRTVIPKLQQVDPMLAGCAVQVAIDLVMLKGYKVHGVKVFRMEGASPLMYAFATPPMRVEEDGQEAISNMRIIVPIPVAARLRFQQVLAMLDHSFCACTPMCEEECDGPCPASPEEWTSQYDTVTTGRVRTNTRTVAVAAVDGDSTISYYNLHNQLLLPATVDDTPLSDGDADAPSRGT